MMRSLLALSLALGAAACSQILGIRPEPAKPFPHRKHVVQGIPCTRCHEGILSADDDLPLHLPGKERCWECHQEGARRALAEGWDPGPLGTEARLADAKRHLRFQHRLHLPKVSGNCARCHQDVSRDNHTLLPRMATCLSCHAHAEAFPKADCDDCHVDLVAEGLRPRSHLVHEEDYVRRHRVDAAENVALCETCHRQTDCAACHGANVAILPQRMAFSRPTLSGLHRAGFRSRHGREAAADRGLCVTCHTESSCAQCHAEEGLAANGRARFDPHPAGWVSASRGGNAHGAAARRDPIACASCHGGAGEQRCVDCHRVGGIGGSIHPPGYASSRNARTELPCRMCHR